MWCRADKEGWKREWDGVKLLFLSLSKYFANCSSIKVFTRPSTIVTFIANAWEHFYSVFSDLCLHFQNILPLSLSVYVELARLSIFYVGILTRANVIFAYFVVMWARCACANCSSTRKKLYTWNSFVRVSSPLLFKNTTDNDRERDTRTHIRPFKPKLNYQS